MESPCQDLVSFGFRKSVDVPSLAKSRSLGETLAVACVTFQPGVSTYVSYLPCFEFEHRVVVRHVDDDDCWHELLDGGELGQVRQTALKIAMEALDSDLDLWEVRGQFAFADPDNKTHRLHAQLSRLRLSSLRYEVGQISRASSEFSSLKELSAQLRERVAGAYGLLAEMTTSSLVDKSDAEASQRENLNQLLSVITALVLAPGVVISFDAAVSLTKNPLSLLLACATSSFIAGAIIIGFSGLRVRLTRPRAKVTYGLITLAQIVGIAVCATRSALPQRYELLAIFASLFICCVVVALPWGRRPLSEVAPERWRETWQRIRNDRPEYWEALDSEVPLDKFEGFESGRVAPRITEEAPPNLREY